MSYRISIGQKYYFLEYVTFQHRAMPRLSSATKLMSKLVHENEDTVFSNWLDIVN